MDYSILNSLGLNKTEVACYEFLDSNGSSKVVQISKKLETPRRSIYYAIKKLQTLGFIETIDFFTPHITYFRAIRLDKALENLAIYQRRAVKRLVEQQVERSIKQQQVHQSQIVKRDWR